MASLGADELLAKAGAVMYDIEIFNAIPDDKEQGDPRLLYCGGWEDYEGMGISVVTAYDFVDSQLSVYLQDNLGDLGTLINSRQILMGYNNKKFDDNVLRANGIDVPHEKSYDLFLQIVNTQPPGNRRGFRLADMLQANGIPPKSGLGSDAPRQAQMNEWGSLITYCIGDTMKQVQLLRMACAGTMKNPKGGSYMTIKLPWEVIPVDMGGIF
jgi:hypothetical protein